jgi:class 3 adenylate cyclase
MTRLFSIWQRQSVARIALFVAIISVGNVVPRALGQDVSFDFARLVEYRDVAPAEHGDHGPHERLVEMKLPISVRFQGLAVGEIELAEEKVRGIAVHIGARVCAMANPGEVLVSSTVRDLVAGSQLTFADRGAHALKGVPGQWHLFAATGDK